MKGKTHLYPGRILWIIFLFMTFLMGLPFFYYYKFSSTGSDIILHNRLRVRQFGIDLSQYIETFPLAKGTASEKLDSIPLFGDIVAELYDEEGSFLVRRDTNYSSDEFRILPLYSLINRILTFFRKNDLPSKEKKSQEIRFSLIKKALEGQRGVGYINESGRIGDNILFLSYPLRDYPGGELKVKGVLFLEVRDSATAIILQNQREQFAVMCLLFTTLLLLYLIYILNVLVFPLRKLLIKAIALSKGTGYLLIPEDMLVKNREVREIASQLDNLSEVLNRKEKEMEEYMTELKHIVRNPLNNIKVAMDAFSSERLSGRDKTLTHIIRNNLAKIDLYISSYYPLSEIEGEQCHAENISVRPFLQEIVTNYEPLSKRRQVQLEIADFDPLIAWKGFYTPLLYVCEQILNNAMDFSPKNGKITLDASMDETGVYIRIADQGRGIPADKKDEIFKQYRSYRAENEGSHTGTGLYLSLKAIRKIGGNITATNNESGGALFQIFLPVYL